jgi:hypothetical protein
MYALILPLGIINFVLVVIQILSGTKVIKMSYKLHRNLGIALGFFVLAHGAIAIFFT